MGNVTAILAAPKAARCQQLLSEARSRGRDYDAVVVVKAGKPLWNWAARTTTGFRHIIDARLALTLRHHGFTRFATANARHFDGFGFEKVWNPVVS